MKTPEQTILDRYIRGFASPQEKLEVDGWARKSEENAKLLSDMRAIYVSALLSDEELEINNTAVRKAGKPGRTFRFAAAATAFAAIVAVAVVLFRNLPESVSEPRLLATVTSDKGQQTTYTMDDGTSVRLNAGSSLEIYECRDMRLVKLNGEAFFDVARNEEMPFVVETEKIKVKVLGTRFDVNAYGDDPSVVLVSGSVKVQECGEEDWTEIDPGQRYVYNSYTGKKEIMNVEADNYVSWTEGYLKFNSATLEFVFGQLQNYYSVPIIYKDNASVKVLLSGKLELNGGLDVALGNLSDLVPMAWSKSDNNTISLIFN